MGNITGTTRVAGTAESYWESDFNRDFLLGSCCSIFRFV